MNNKKEKVTTFKLGVNMPGKEKKEKNPKRQARLDAKVRPDEPVSEDRIYLNMPKKKSSCKEKNS